MKIFKNNNHVKQMNTLKGKKNHYERSNCIEIIVKLLENHSNFI
jgi:hypothetical protein